MPIIFIDYHCKLCEVGDLNIRSYIMELSWPYNLALVIKSASTYMERGWQGTKSSALET